MIYMIYKVCLAIISIALCTTLCITLGSASINSLDVSSIQPIVLPSISNIVQQNGNVHESLHVQLPCTSCVQNGEVSDIQNTTTMYAGARSDIVRYEIDSLSNEIKNKSLHWTPGITPLTGISDQQKLQRLGVSDGHESLDVSNTVAIESINTTIPLSYDLRYTSTGDYTTPVKDQGSCGTCWAFATNAVVESTKEILTKNPNLNPDYSEWYLVVADSRTCNSGGYSAFQYYINKAGKDNLIGGVYEYDWPYSSKYTVDVSDKQRTSISAVKKGTTYVTIDTIKQLIYQYGSVYVHFQIYNSFYSYKSGIYSRISNSDRYYGLHAVQVIGYNKDAQGRDYLICKNSWGTYWGEQGYFKIYADQAQILSTYIYYLEYTVPKPTPTPTVIPTATPTQVPTSIPTPVPTTPVPTPTIQPTPTPTLQPQPPLIADFSVSKSRIKRYETVTFMDYSRGNPTSWAWFIGLNVGGKVPDATTPNVNYMFNRFGYYNVKLTVKRVSDNTQSSTTKIRCVKVL